MNIHQLKAELLQAWTDSQLHLDFKMPFSRWLRHHRGVYTEMCKQFLDWEKLQHAMGKMV